MNRFNVRFEELTSEFYGVSSDPRNGFRGGLAFTYDQYWIDESIDRHGNCCEDKLFSMVSIVYLANKHELVDSYLLENLESIVCACIDRNVEFTNQEGNQMLAIFSGLPKNIKENKEIQSTIDCITKQSSGLQ